MEEILATVDIDNNRSIHIAELARQTVIDAGVEHLGFGGLFLFETNDSPINKGLNILGKVASLEAAFRMAELWMTRPIEN